MNIDDGASHEILTRWPDFRQRNVALDRDVYGRTYADHMMAGIHLIRKHHQQLQDAGITTWTISDDLTRLLDELANTPTARNVTTSISPSP